MSGGQYSLGNIVRWDKVEGGQYLLGHRCKASVNDIHISGQDFSSQPCGWAVVIIHYYQCQKCPFF